MQRTPCESERLMMRHMLCLLSVFALAVVSIEIVHAHGGGLDQYGCHHDRKRGGYHCHRTTTPPPSTPVITPPSEPMPPEKPLVVNAGPDQFTEPGAMVVLSGTTDVPRDAIRSYAWTQTSGPSVSLYGTNNTVAVFAAPRMAHETLIFQFTVVGTGGVIRSDDVKVRVVEEGEEIVSLGTDDEYACRWTARTEDDFNDCLCREIGGEREVRHDYAYDDNQVGYVMVDCETEHYAIEGGLDERSSLDSLQQALFFGALTGKIPAVVIYDTDGVMGPYEHRTRVACAEARVLFLHLKLVGGQLVFF